MKKKNGGGNIQSTLANNQIKLKSFVARENRMWNAYREFII